MALRSTAVDTLIHDFGRIKVHRDDLDEMITILRGVARDSRISVDDWELDEVNDLRELASKGITRVRTFVFSADQGRVGLHIGRRRGLLAIREPDLVWRGAAAEVERIARRCRGLHLVAHVDTRTRSEAPTFLQRKKDDIWVALISGVVFLALGFVIGRFLG